MNNTQIQNRRNQLHIWFYVYKPCIMDGNTHLFSHSGKIKKINSILCKSLWLKNTNPFVPRRKEFLSTKFLWSGSIYKTFQRQLHCVVEEVFNIHNTNENNKCCGKPLFSVELQPLGSRLLCNSTKKTTPTGQGTLPQKGRLICIFQIFLIKIIFIIMKSAATALGDVVHV